ncbi:MAG: hypothetical protein PHO32_03025 [Candidatus Cloacimonetes bacterium]|nr:hypothetical protein [Candidatus Cloacimonadota bacterium]
MRDVYLLLNRAFLFPIAEKIGRTSIIEDYKRLKKSEWLTRDDLLKLQNEKLIKLVHHCYDNVPYYRKMFNSLSILPKDIETSEDLSKIPVLTKELIRENYEQLISAGSDLRRSRLHSTGGSTGAPLQYLSDNRTWSFSWASTFRAWSSFGFHFGEKIFTIGGNSLVNKTMSLTKKDMFEKLLMRNYKRSSAEMRAVDMALHYRYLMRYKPVAIRGYPSAIYVIAKFIAETGLLAPKIKMVLTTGEVLLPAYRAKIQEVFQVPIYDSYGAGDGGIASYECYMHEGLHVCEERCVLEILDKDHNTIKDGAVGHVISTDLENYSFPFLRYQVGDMSYFKSDFCSCGRKSKLLGEVMGRNGKLLHSKSGVPISPTMLPIMLYPNSDYQDTNNQKLYNRIDRFQIRQFDTGDLVIYLKMKQPIDVDVKLYDYVIDNYKKHFVGSNIKLSFVQNIPPLPSGKEDYVISEFKPNNPSV